MLKISVIAVAATLILATIPSATYWASAAPTPRQVEPVARQSTPSSHGRAVASGRRHTSDLAADQAAVTAGTLAAKGGSGYTVTEAVVYQNYALTTYQDNYDGDTGQCVFVYTAAGTWQAQSCSAGFFSVADIQRFGYTTPYWIAYNLATSSPQTWANEQTVDRLNGRPLPVAPSCTPDSMGYCVARVSNASSPSICGWPAPDGQEFDIYNDIYPGSLNGYIWVYVDDGNCGATPQWQGPSAYDATGDPTMPGGYQDQSGAPRG